MEVHETAFVTCGFRAMYRELSKDKFAHLWLNDSVQKWVDAYLSTVTPEEAVAHSFRNRYYLDSLKKLVSDKKIGFLINFGCGFSMYPYLLPDTLHHIEIDKPEVIRHKEKQTRSWVEEGVLPKRNITRVSCDFSERFENELYSKIMDLKQDTPCFILLEGVLFFLNRQETQNLFQLFNNLQGENDWIGTVSFREEDTKNSAFELLLSFMEQEHTTGSEEVVYQTVEDHYYSDLPFYEIADHQDFFSLASHYGYTPSKEKDMIINEQFYLLKKTGKAFLH